MEKDDRLSWCDYNGTSVEEELEVSKLALPTSSSRGGKKKSKKAAASGWDIPADEGAAVLVDEAPALKDASPTRIRDTNDWGLKWSRNGAWSFGGFDCFAAKPQHAAEEAVATEEPCFAAPEEHFPPDEPCLAVPEEDSLAKDTFPAEEAVFNEDHMEMEEAVAEAVPDAVLEASQAELIIEGFDDAKEHSFSQNG